MKRRHFLTFAGVATFGAPVLFAGCRARGTKLNSDGAGSLGRIGVLTPDFDPVPESEMWVMAPPGVSVHASRVPWETREARAFAEPPNVDAAAERLVALAPSAIVFAFTSSSYALGPQGDGPLRERLEERVRGIPVVLTCPAATEALRVLGAKRVALVHPPWFTEEVNAQGGEYFRAQGFDVALCARMTPARTFTEVPAAEVHDWVRANTPREAEAVFIAGNGLRAIGAIQALETDLGRPVLSANQVALWGALRVAKIGADVTQYGAVFHNRG